MFELKVISKESIPAALEKAERYRLLNDPIPAESICLDILKIDPSNQKALITLILAMSDNLADDYSIGDTHIKDYVARIEDEYKRTYYTGIVFERRAKAILQKGPEGSESTAYELFRQAMDWFEKADAIRPESNEEAILRWNGCARLIQNNNLRPRRIHSDFIE